MFSHLKREFFNTRARLNLEVYGLQDKKNPRGWGKKGPFLNEINPLHTHFSFFEIYLWQDFTCCSDPIQKQKLLSDISVPV